MKFSDYIYKGRTHKCVILESPCGDTVYCSFHVFGCITHNPTLKWSVVTRVHPETKMEYNFIKVYIPTTY